MNATVIALSLLATNVSLQTFLLGKSSSEVEAILGKPSLPNGGVNASGIMTTYDCGITVFYSHNGAVNLHSNWYCWRISTLSNKTGGVLFRVETNFDWLSPYNDEAMIRRLRKRP